MIDRRAVSELITIAASLGIDREWHHADTRGLTIRLVGGTLSNAHPATSDSSEFCLVLVDKGEGKEVAVVNVATLIANACDLTHEIDKCTGQLRNILRMIEQARA